MREGREWTSEQRELIEMGADGRPRLPRVAVAADAGAGKTSVLVERVRGLAPEARALCVSFTERSKADLEERLADRLSAEVYTIHGFCARVVSEFGARLGLPPFHRIMDADEREELFYESFEKVYRRAPPLSTDRGVDAFWQICRTAAEERAARIRDLSESPEHEGDLARFVAEVFDEFAGAKRQKRVLEYSDLESCALALLEQGEVRTALRARYDHVFVDEFQDTSRLQCALVRLLAGTERPVFVVGDTKQSIYRFRGAEVEVFREFVAELPAHRRLSANFRSHAEVIGAVNAVCTPVIADYGAMVAGRPESHRQLAADVFMDSGALPRVARVTAAEDAEAIAAIVRGLTARGVESSQIVLLLRRIKGKEELFRALDRLGVTVAITTGSSARFNADIKRLLNLWIWACEPWQKLRAAQVATDFQLANRAELESAISELATLDAAPSLNAATCEQLVRKLDQRFGLAQRFGAVFEQFEVFILRHQREGVSPNALARRLQHLLLNGQDVSGFTLLPPPANLGRAGAIRALTIHSAKGLEFPVVILADVGPQRKRGTGILKSGADVWIPPRDDEGAPDWTAPGVKEAKLRDGEAELAESARLLYVAMTRAQEALYIVDRGEPVEDGDESKKKKKPKAPAPSWSAWLKAGIERTLPSETFAPTAKAAGSRTQAAGERGAHELSRPLEAAAPVYERSRVGISRLTASEAPEKPAWQSEKKKIETETNSRDARSLGINIHRCFELGDWAGLKREAEAGGLDLTAFWRWFETDEGRGVFSKSVRSYDELAFEWQRDGQILVGRVDRLLVFEEEAWVIDYKILLRRRPASEILETYGPQLQAYADAIQTMMYPAKPAAFPMTKAPRVRAFVLDVTAASGRCWLEVPPRKS